MDCAQSQYFGNKRLHRDHYFECCETKCYGGPEMETVDVQNVPDLPNGLPSLEGIS